MIGFSWQIVPILFAIGLSLFAPPHAWVESHYANGFYPAWDRFLRAFTDRVPFSIGDVLFLGSFIALIAICVHCVREAKKKHFLHAVLATTLGVGSFVAIGFLWFMLSWAYNYDRISLKQKMLLHPDRTGVVSVAALADRTVRMLNANVAGAHAARYDDVTMQRLLEPTFYATIQRLGDRATFAPTPVKPTMFESFMNASATYGFTDPWTHEINLSSSLSPLERPAAYAHEWSHLSGFADESEANFIAAISCINAKEPALRYSGWMLIWFSLPPTIHVHQRALPAVIADVNEIVARYRRQTKPAVAKAQRAVYGSYLRANNVRAGFDSYQLFVQLITAGEFDANGLPVVRKNM